MGCYFCNKKLGGEENIFKLWCNEFSMTVDRYVCERCAGISNSLPPEKRSEMKMKELKSYVISKLDPKENRKWIK